MSTIKNDFRFVMNLTDTADQQAFIALWDNFEKAFIANPPDMQGNEAVLVEVLFTHSQGDKRKYYLINFLYAPKKQNGEKAYYFAPYGVEVLSFTQYQSKKLNAHFDLNNFKTAIIYDKN